MQFGRWYTPPATQPAWDFQEREWPDKTLQDVFPQAAKAEGLDFAGTQITPLGASDTLELQSLFAIDGPPLGSLGWSPIPILSFRVTLVGDRQEGHTLLGLVIPHLIMDATGMATIIKTWGRLYRGESVPPRTGDPHPDLLNLLDSLPADQLHQEIEDDEYPDRGYKYGLSPFLEMLQYTKKATAVGAEEQYIHFPGPLLQRYRDEAREKLAGQDIGLPVSRLDVFCAMMVKVRTGDPNFLFLIPFSPL